MIVIKSFVIKGKRKVPVPHATTTRTQTQRPQSQACLSARSVPVSTICLACLSSVAALAVEWKSNNPCRSLAWSMLRRRSGSSDAESPPQNNITSVSQTNNCVATIFPVPDEHVDPSTLIMSHHIAPIFGHPLAPSSWLCHRAMPAHHPPHLPMSIFPHLFRACIYDGSVCHGVSGFGCNARTCASAPVWQPTHSGGMQTHISVPVSGKA